MIIRWNSRNNIYIYIYIYIYISVIWKYDLADKIKRSFFQSNGRVDTAIWMHYLDVNKTAGEKASRQSHDCELYLTSPGGNTPQNSSFTATHYPSRTLSMLDEPDMRDTTGEVWTNSYIYSCGPLHMDQLR